MFMQSRTQIYYLGKEIGWTICHLLTEEGWALITPSGKSVNFGTKVNFGPRMNFGTFFYRFLSRRSANQRKKVL
jgi:hypothetical protein